MRRFGIEQECFVLAQGRAPTVAQIQRAFENLEAYGWVAEYDQESEIQRVTHATPHGQLLFGTDFCTHVVELAYPPLDDLDALASVHAAWSEIDASLAAAGIDRMPGAMLDQLPDGWTRRTSANDNGRLRRLIDRPASEGPYFERFHQGMMCATQLHLDASDELLENLPELYALEYLAPLLFTQSRGWRGKALHCTRPLLYRDAFAPGYKACAIPTPIPTSRAQHAALIEATTNYIRDYSFIAVHRLGTLEFRSTCSQPDLARLEELVALRVATAEVVAAGRRVPARDPAVMFWAACELGAVDPDLLAADLAALGETRAALPANVAVALDRVLDRASC